jgi:hypothetical protein
MPMRYGSDINTFPLTSYASMIDMDIKRLATNFVSQILVPALTYTLLEKLTAHVVVALGGTVAMVALALWIPSITTGLRSLDHLIERLRAQRRGRYIDDMCRFLNAYLHILTKYPPAILPENLSRCVHAHLAAFAHAFRSLQGRRTQGYATSYDMIRVLRFRNQDFEGWRLAACEAWWMAFLSDLLQIPDNPMQRALQLGLDRAEAHLWQYHLETAESRFDRAFAQALAQHPVLQYIRACEALRQRVIAILQLDTVPGQAQLQTALQQHPAFESAYDAHELIALLRHDVVADAVRSYLADSPPSTSIPVTSSPPV